MTRVLLGFAALFLVAVLTVRFIYGGGTPFPELVVEQDPDAPAVEIVFQYPEPIAGLAVGPTGDVFFTVHTAAHPQGNQLLRVRDGVAEPFPSGAAQQQDFNAPLGIALDGANRLWVLDHGIHGTVEPKLFAFDAETGERVHDHTFSREDAPRGSLLQSLAVTADGSTVFIADTSLFRRKPALIVYTPADRSTRRLLERAVPLSSQSFLIDAKGHNMQFFAGLFSFMPGIAGVALGPGEQWLYVSASSHDGLYRIATEMLADPAVGSDTLAGAIERYSDKPLSEGLALRADGDVIITDIEHGGLVRIGADRRPRALAAPDALRWPASVAIGPDGAVWFGDSALQTYLFSGDERVAEGAPYNIYRTSAPPGP